ncbi:MAG TPA: hypothetical protein VIH91_11610 [Terriglobales bacterium]
MNSTIVDMNKRPIYVTLLGYVLIAAGAIGIAYHFTEYKYTPPRGYLLVLLVRLVAVVSGVYVLRGKDWERWLSIAWIAFHLVISIFHTKEGVAVHAVVLIAFTVLLFLPAANRYFRSRA